MSLAVESMGEWKRTDYAGALREKNIGQAVVLCGWVHARRDHGGVSFIDLRDRSGIVQLVFDPSDHPQAHQRAGEVRLEFVVAVSGIVRARPSDTVNPELPTGGIEVAVAELRLLNTSRPTPYPIDDAADVTEQNRLRFRYLDLRRPRVQSNFVLRHRVAQAVRQHLNAAGFLEVETPVLTRSTPEGARDYLVPSRVQRGGNRPSSSSSSSWCPASIATTRSSSASVTRTCARTGSPSSRRWIWRCRSSRRST
jgi:aspartyl-tRNA synthetase